MEQGDSSKEVSGSLSYSLSLPLCVCMWVWMGHGGFPWSHKANAGIVLQIKPWALSFQMLSCHSVWDNDSIVR
jgi:hypothetical protein